jgi:hypothetical protein
MFVAAFGHPFSAGEMVPPGTAGTCGFVCRIDVEHDACPSEVWWNYHMRYFEL